MQAILEISLEDIKSNWIALNNASNGKAAAVIKDYDITEDSLDVVRVRAKKANVKVDFIGIGWVPA